MVRHHSSSHGLGVTESLLLWLLLLLLLKRQLPHHLGPALAPAHLGRQLREARPRHHLLPGHLGRPGPLQAELQAWISGLERGRIVGPSAWEGYAATRVTELGVAAVRSPERVAIDYIAKPALYA